MDGDPGSYGSRGETFASRHSLSHLSTMGLKKLVARNKNDYVELAISLASDVEELGHLRVELREKMANSPVCDGRRFANGFTKIMRQIWHDWCLSQSNGQSTTIPKAPSH